MDSSKLRVSGLPVKMVDSACRGTVYVDPMMDQHIVMVDSGAWFCLDDRWESDLDPEAWYYCLTESGKLIELTGSSVLDGKHKVRGIVGEVHSTGITVPASGMFLGRMENDDLVVVRDLRSWYDGSALCYNGRGILISEWRPALNIKCIVRWEIGEVYCGWVRCDDGRCYQVDAKSGENYGVME